MKVIFGISAKLIFMVTFIVVAAIGGVVAIATDLFKDESVTRVQEMNKDLAERLAVETFSTLEKSVDKSKLVFQTLVKNEAVVKDAEAMSLAENILRQNDEILDFGIYRWQGKELHEAVFLQKREAQAEFEMTPDVFKSKPLAVMAKDLTKSLKEPVYVFNSSYLYKKPVLTVFYPVNPDSASVWVVRMELRQEPFIKAFAKKRQVSSYWVTSDGVLLVHSNPKLSLKNYDFSQSPIVQKAKESKFDNLQMEFSDTQDVSYLGAFKRIPVGDSIIVAQIETEVALAAINRVQFRATLVACIVVGLAFLLNFSFSQSLTSPLSKLYRATEKISLGQFNFTLKAESSDEIGALTVAFSKMAVGLQERDKLKSTFNKFHSKEIADKIMSGEVKLGGERKVATVFFSDIRGFTAFSEQLSPDEVVKFLNEYMTEMVTIVKKHKGVVDKYVGDAIMALWGVPEASGNDVVNALNAALEMREVLVKFNSKRNAAGKPEIKIGMGIHSGEVLAGNIGSEERLEYTVIGDTVNQASRIESANKILGSDILISASALNMVRSQFAVGPALSLQVPGRAEKITVHEVIGSKDNAGQIRTILSPSDQDKIKSRDLRAIDAAKDESYHEHAAYLQTNTMTAVHPSNSIHANSISFMPSMPPAPERANTQAHTVTKTFASPVPVPGAEMWFLVRDSHNQQVEGPYFLSQLKSISEAPQFNMDSAYVFREGDPHMVALFEMPGFSRRTAEKIAMGVPYGIPLPSIDLARRTQANQWLVYGVDATIYGPFNFVQLDQMVAAGNLSRTSYIWQPGMEYWIYLHQMPGFERRGKAA